MNTQLISYFQKLRKKMSFLRESSKDFVQEISLSNDTDFIKFAETQLIDWFQSLERAFELLQYYYHNNENSRAIHEETLLPFAHNYDVLAYQKNELSDIDPSLYEEIVYKNIVDSMFKTPQIPSEQSICQLAEIHFKKLLFQNKSFNNDEFIVNVKQKRNNDNQYDVIISWSITMQIRGSRPTVFFLCGTSPSSLDSEAIGYITEQFRSMKDMISIHQLMYRVDRDTSIVPERMYYFAITNYFPTEVANLLLMKPKETIFPELQETDTIIICSGELVSNGFTSISMDKDLIKSDKENLQKYADPIADAFYGESEEQKLFFCGDFMRYQEYYNTTKKKLKFIKIH